MRRLLHIAVLNLRVTPAHLFQFLMLCIISGCGLLEPQKAYLETTKYFFDCQKALENSEKNNNDSAILQSYCGTLIHSLTKNNQCFKESVPIMAKKVYHKLDEIGFKCRHRNAQDDQDEICKNFGEGRSQDQVTLILKTLYNCKMPETPDERACRAAKEGRMKIGRPFLESEISICRISKLPFFGVH